MTLETENTACVDNCLVEHQDLPPEIAQLNTSTDINIECEKVYNYRYIYIHHWILLYLVEHDRHIMLNIGMEAGFCDKRWTPSGRFTKIGDAKNRRPVAV